MPRLLPGSPPDLDTFEVSAARPVKLEHARGVHATWMYTLGSIVFVDVVLAAGVLLVAIESFLASRTPINGALLVMMLAATAVQVRYCWFLRSGLGGGLPRTAWNVALLAPAGAAWLLGLFTPGFGAVAGFPLWMALCLMACLVNRRQRGLILAGGLAAVVLHPFLGAWLRGAAAELLPSNSMVLIVFYGAFFPVMVLSSLWWWGVVVTIDQHRRTAAELAVAQERLRFAADLHDIQGHHLQVIALKSELAERLLDIDVEAARANIHETRIIAKQALEETRLLVSGYREIALDEELENAREVLSAAGAECTLELDARALSAGADAGPDAGAAGIGGVAASGAEARHALAMAVREATTNILRHSAATEASIRLRLEAAGGGAGAGAGAGGGTGAAAGAGAAWVLAVRNNGLVDATAPSRVPGSGLAGLRDRVTALGGELETIIELENDSFELRVRVPIQREVAA